MLEQHHSFRDRAEARMHPLNLTWNAVATLSNVPRQNLYKYRDNISAPNVFHALRIAQALRTKVEKLWQISDVEEDK